MNTFSPASEDLNTYAQKLIKQATLITEKEIAKTSDDFLLANLNLLHSSLHLFAMLSKSSNDIPSLRGLGFEPALQLAETIVEHGSVSSQTLNFQFAHFFKNVQLTRG